jgi:Leucine-rich repeat (LRR) protein
MFFVLKQVGVKMFCLISDKQKHADDIKDFSQSDLSKFEKLTLPWVSCKSNKEQDFLEIGSIDKNAFVELKNLKCLHLNIQPKLQPHTYDKIDFKHLINLKELCLESKFEYELNHPPHYLDWSPPPNLEKLTIIFFNIKLNTLTHLKNLNFLHLDKVKYLGLTDSKTFLDFANLKHLDLTPRFESTTLVFDCINSSSLHMGPKRLEVLNMGYIGVGNGQQPKIFFENMPNLEKLQVVVKSLEEIDLVSLKKLSWLEDLSLDVVACSDEGDLTGVLGNFSKLKKLSVQGLSRVDRDIFKQFPNLESLTLWGRNLRDIQSGSFDSLTNLTALHLRSNKLEQLDEDLFKSLTQLVSLNLSWNPLKRIPSKLFANLAALNELNLDGCELPDLEPKTFNGLENLNKLKLRCNKFTNLDEESFKGLKNLTQLDLSENELKEINEETFEDTCNLIELDLSYNELIDIRLGLNNESGLQQLKCLSLRGNNLEKFEINLRNLEELNLGSNEPLTRLRPGAFKNLRNFKRLYLCDCSLKVVDAKAFEGLLGLEHLDLANNFLEDIGVGTFKNLSNLKRLDLDRCSLKVLDAYTFEGLLSLEHLNLAYNCLEDIGEGTFDLMGNLKMLDISKNHSLLK